MIDDEYTSDRLNKLSLEKSSMTTEPKPKFTPVPKRRYPKWRDANWMP